MAPLPAPRSRTVDAIYAAYAARSGPGWRSSGLAVSELATECERALWYRLRWADANDPPDGRRARLFDTGNREEARLIDDLRAAGMTVWDVDPATGRQYPIRLADEHVRGKADGVVLGVPDAPATPHLLEAKSHNAKNFRELVRAVERAETRAAGLAEAFPKHYAQCQLGMAALGLTRALYLAVSKDTDEIEAVRIEYDAEFALRAEARGRRIVATDHAPPRLHADPAAKAAWACRFCPALAVCHEGEFPAGDATTAARNCRTCLHAAPAPGGAWTCARAGGARLSLDDQKRGCGAHLWLPDLVPGEQEDADAVRETVTYRLASGAVFVDGAGRAAA
jgi:hypothetical protein